MATIRTNISGNNIPTQIGGNSIPTRVAQRNVQGRVNERNIDTRLYPPSKDYNLLFNKPAINGVTLEGDIASEDLGLASAPLIGGIDDITPAMALTALQEGRVVLLETTITIGDFTVPVVFLATLIAANMVGGTQVVSYIDGTDAIRAMQLAGVGGGTWTYTEVELARQTTIPVPGDGTPQMDSPAGSAGDDLSYARFDHIHPSDIHKLAATSAATEWERNTPYAVGDIVVHNGILYKCIEAHAGFINFQPEYWQAIPILNGKGYVEKAALTSGIPFGEVDSTSTSTVFTATVPGIKELKNGVCVMLRNGVVTSAAGFTININGLGAKPSYTNLAAATADTTIFNANYTMLFVYDEDRVAGGCWICYRGYDANTNTIGYQIRSNSYSLPMDSITYRYRLLFRSVDGTKFVPANNATSTNATAKRTTNQTPIDPWGDIVYYGTTASVAAGSRPSASYLWTQYGITLGYSFNRTGAALTLTSWKPVYIKAAPQASGGAIIEAETPFVQDLPTTNDGYIYIYLGVAYSATAVELTLNHPVYYHDGTKIRRYTG